MACSLRFCRELVIKMDMNNLIKFSWDCFEEYWIPTSGCRRLLVQLLQHLKRLSFPTSFPQGLTNMSLQFTCAQNWVDNCLLILIHLWNGCKCYCWQEAAEELTPRLEIILQHLLCAYGKYQVSFMPLLVHLVHCYISFSACRVSQFV